MIKKILSNVSNKVKAIYSLWILFNLSLLLFNAKEINLKDFSYTEIYYYNFTVGMGYSKGNPIISHLEIFFPFTSLSILDMRFVAFYDITEFIFYTIFPIFIYVIIKLFTTKYKPNE